MKNQMKWVGTGLFGLAIAGMGISCTQTSPPANIAVPANPTGPAYGYPADYPKPMPDQSASAQPPAPAFDDPPLVDQRLPEEAWFISSYNKVGRPKIAVFVNRTLDGNVVAGQSVPVSSTDTIRRSTGGVEFSQSQHSGSSDYYSRQHQGTSESFKSNGPAEYHETNTTFLRPGQYDEADLQALDYSEIESQMTDWLHASGQVTLISPDFIRSKLSDSQVKDLQSGKANGLNDLGQATQADVLVQTQAHPTRREGQLVVLLIAEAVNVRGGESLAQASVEMPTPIDRYKLNNYTRFLARKLMHDMVGTWNGTPAAGQPAASPEPASPPPSAPVPAPVVPAQAPMPASTVPTTLP